MSNDERLARLGLTELARDKEALKKHVEERLKAIQEEQLKALERMKADVARALAEKSPKI